MWLCSSRVVKSLIISLEGFFLKVSLGPRPYMVRSAWSPGHSHPVEACKWDEEESGLNHRFQA